MLPDPAREFDVATGEGRVVRAWGSKGADAHGTVLLCPELGAIPEIWPTLLDSAYVVSWLQRGAVPATPDRYVADALAVIDAAGVDRCVVAGWSVGSAVATAFARRHPDRVSGLLLLGGAPGLALDGLLSKLGVPTPLYRLLSTGSARSLQFVGPVLEAAMRRLPVNELSAQLLQRIGVMRPEADPALVVTALRRFLQHEWLWYATLALALEGTGRGSLRGVACPITVMAGQYDVLSDLKSITDAAAALPQARLRVLPASHFLPLEAADEINRELRLLLWRVEAVEYARLGEEPPYPWPGE